MAIIEVDGVHKAYAGRPAVDGVSFAVDEGEIFGILGPNGAGKTTTVECVEGLRVPDAGTVRVADGASSADPYSLTRSSSTDLAGTVSTVPPGWTVPGASAWSSREVSRTSS